MLYLIEGLGIPLQLADKVRNKDRLDLVLKGNILICNELDDGLVHDMSLLRY